MNPITKLTFTGVNGEEFSFAVYPKHISVNKGPALYSFLKRVNGKYYVLYIGQTTDLAERLPNHHKWEEASRNGFEFLAICRSVSVRNLESAEASLIQKYKPRCNEVVPH